MNILQRQIARDLIAHQHSDLVEQLAEILGARLLVTHNGKLVGDQGMIDDMKLTHSHSSLFYSLYYNYTQNPPFFKYFFKKNKNSHNQTLQRRQTVIE